VTYPELTGWAGRGYTRRNAESTGLSIRYATVEERAETPAVRYVCEACGRPLADLRQCSEHTCHLWPCGCLPNEAGAHRVGCPDHPEGDRGHHDG